VTSKRRTAQRGLFSPTEGLYSSLAILRDRFMSIAFDLETTLETSLGELYDVALKGNPVWLSVSDLSVKLVGPELPLSDSPDVSPPSRGALELAGKALEPWALEHNLADPWCVEWVIENKLFDRWARERGVAGVTHKIWMAPALLKAILFAPASEVFWQPMEEPRAEFIRRALARLNAELVVYCDAIEAHATTAGYILIPDRSRSEDHFKWLVRFQVKCEKPAEIWKSYKGDKRSRRAFEKAIQETAKLIGLTPRQ
jgi:hypothetical protein